MIQTRHVIKELTNKLDNVACEIVAMSTKGDEVLDRALFKIGDKNLFTKELENALLDGSVDIVVHSLKDLPSQLPPGLVIGAILEREDPADAVVIKSGSKFSSWSDLASAASDKGDAEAVIVGTSSVRRSAQLRSRYPHIVIKDVRGNLNTRLKKLDDPEGDYSALVLASAGLHRMGWGDRLSHVKNDNN